ncbi:LacI family DNA-binding transcriptional regulator [Cellvibrio japonicus]|uniref:Putative Fructose repressor n=1 Tax=Cellvibrio japonicus (strain Ueda107) TaxID=498211 RepID=B3PH00_CELJU|nr:substrate-binding domain-containing protein [Cellvibrio japonicus]ACE84559.1 putative Fructose repressor [Cellvibrio japonicus Ueda107]QEI13800.1 LacI family DNA-binding transcriptional regulator [Cellvibrio japonicus]QEI17374.1 LacI family DNA-binding transcriptional regulator [Cellvibrio japonicus]QEI20950.1 LacI family DNA-binding transcriptional regulator [Cellvibrio japonicus]
MAKTIEEIAEDLGISVTTVRLVLLGKARQYRISAKTEERVNRYIQEHGYQINHTARSLRLQRTDSLALIVPRLSNHFFALLAERLEIRCRAAGLQLFISCCYDNPETQVQLIRNFHQRNIDGLFVVPSNAEIPPLAAPLFDQRLVLLDRDFGFTDYSVVVTANEESSYQLTSQLQAFLQQRQGDSRFLFLAGNPQMPSIAGRLQGFRRALAQLGVSDQQVEIYQTPRNGFDEGVEVMNRYLHDHQPCPGVLIASSIALFEGALHALRSERGGVPAEMLLATFDDHTMLDFLPNPLCSVRQDYEDMINTAFAEMEKLIQGQREPRRHVAAMEIIKRNV